MFPYIPIPKGRGFTLLVIMFWLAFFHGTALCGIFSNKPADIAAAAEYLQAYGIDCLFTCLVFCVIGFCNGLGHTKFVMVQGILSAFAVRIPVSYIMSRTVGTLFSIGLAIPCSSVFQIILQIIFLIHLRKVYRNPHAQRLNTTNEG